VVDVLRMTKWSFRFLFNNVFSEIIWTVYRTEFLWKYFVGERKKSEFAREISNDVFDTKTAVWR